MTPSEHSDGSKQPETNFVELTTTTAGHALHTDNGHDFTSKQGDINQAAQDETSMGLLTALRNYPKTAAWSILLSTSIVMVAYDTILLNSFYAYPSFQKKYGACNAKGKCQVPAKWQSGLSNGSNVGGIIGLLSVGCLCDAYGSVSDAY